MRSPAKTVGRITSIKYAKWKMLQYTSQDKILASQFNWAEATKPLHDDNSSLLDSLDIDLIIEQFIQSMPQHKSFF